MTIFFKKEFLIALTLLFSFFSVANAMNEEQKTPKTTKSSTGLVQVDKVEFGNNLNNSPKVINLNIFTINKQDKKSNRKVEDLKNENSK